jgi:hypothetical protein
VEKPAQHGCLLNRGRRLLDWPLKLGGARKGSGLVPNEKRSNEAVCIVSELGFFSAEEKRHTNKRNGNEDRANLGLGTRPAIPAGDRKQSDFIVPFNFGGGDR